MSIFVASTKSISRGKGQSAVACASYRAGVQLKDERYGKTHDYSKRYGVMSEKIILPTHLQNKNIEVDREDIWNKAEKAEKRKDARVAREWLFNLSYELSEEEREQLAHQISQLLADRYGVIADCAIHQPTQKEIDRGADPRNFHAHVMLTTRKVELNDDNEIILTDKSTAELSDKKRRSLGLERMSQEVKEVRKMWEEVANKKLAEHNLNLIDSRSYKEQGIDIIPQIKMGVDATHMERRTGKKSDKGIINDMIKNRNELVFNRELRENETINNRADQIIFESRQRNEREQENDRVRTAIKRTTRISQWASNNSEWATKNLEWATKNLEWATKNLEWATEVASWADRRIARVNKAVDDSKQAINDSEQAVTERVSEQRTAPRPNPFAQRRTKSSDRREQSTAELAEQKRRLDSETRRADTDARKHKYEDKRLAERVASIKLNLANRLIIRNNDNMRVRWEWYETAEEYPDKFDKRQLETLDKFEQSLNVDNLDYREKLSHIRDLMSGDFIKEHSDVIDILKDPKAEREQYTQEYNANIANWLEFKENIDKQRDEFNDSIAEKYGNAGEVGRMTRDIISSFSYMKALDSFIDDDKQTDQAKELAEQHRADTLNKTCQQFKYSYFDVLKLRDSTELNNYANALNSTLDTFKEVYGSELSESQNKAIESGVYSFERDVQQIQSRSRGLSR